MSSVRPPTPDPAPPEPPAPGPRWGLGDAAVTLLLTLFLGSVAVAGTNALVDGPWHSASGRAWATVLLLVVPWLGLAGWPVLAARTRGNGPRRDYFLGLDRRGAGIGVGAALASLVVASVVATVQEHLTGKPLTSAVGDIAENTTSASTGALVVLALCTAFGAPVVEELAFRGLLFGALVKRGTSVLTSAVVTTLLFAGFHFEPSRIAVLLVLGGALTAVRVWTGSTGASMVAHLTINLQGAIAILALRHGG